MWTALRVRNFEGPSPSGPHMFVGFLSGSLLGFPGKDWREIPSCYSQRQGMSNLDEIHPDTVCNKEVLHPRKTALAESYLI